MNIQSQFGLDGRVFVVTGGSDGIGRAMAGFLAAAGAAVVLVARRETELRAAAEAINAAQRRDAAATVAADLADLPAIADTAAQCLKKFGEVDGVINAAGVTLRVPPEEITIAGWTQTLNLNLAAPFFFSRELIPGMRARNYGRIVNIASLQSRRAFKNGLAYGASKGGVAQLTRAMAEAYSRDGITCNAIAPGFFSTNLTAPVFEDSALAEKLAAHTAIGRNGELNDLFGATVFLAAPASGYITGQTLFVDGGFTAK